MSVHPADGARALVRELPAASCAVSVTLVFPNWRASPGGGTCGVEVAQ